MKEVTREDIIDLLKAWERDEISALGVLEKAELWLGEYGWHEFSRDDPRSIVVEVLDQLESLHVQWILKEDIPAFLDFLSTTEGHEIEAWQNYIEYINSIDLDERENKLPQESIYKPKQK